MDHRTTNRRFFIAFTACAVLGLVGCDEQTAPAAEPPSASATESAETLHAAPGVEPGSHEDWCGEHQVPESLCTRCNPSLTAAFKATGDWCEEHGLPESQCLECNPELTIERPPPAGERGQ